MKLSLCIMGCGGYAKTVMNDIHDMTDEFDFYFASRDENKAKAYSEQYGGKGYFGSYEDAVADERIDAVYFFTPHHVHLENAQLAAQNSKHIMMEKPIARDMAESKALIAAAKDGGVKLMVAENYRFLPAVQKCKQIIEADNIGKVRSIHIVAEGYSAPSEWRNDAELTGGGSFIDGGIHFVDILLNLGGYPEKIYAVKPPQIHRKSQGEDGVDMMARLPGGAVGVINFSRATPIKGNRHLIAITGSKGVLSFEPYADEIIFENTTATRTIRLPQAKRGAPGMVKEFRQSILEDREPEMSGEEALKDLAIVLAAYKSADEGGEISLALP